MMLTNNPGEISPGVCGTKNSGLESKPERPPIYWMHEAIEYLGLGRLDLARPDKAMYHLIDRGVLHPRKIAGPFVFNKKELDTLIANGDQKRERDHPRNI